MVSDEIHLRHRGIINTRSSEFRVFLQDGENFHDKTTTLQDKMYSIMRNFLQSLYAVQGKQNIFCAPNAPAQWNTPASVVNQTYTMHTFQVQIPADCTLPV